MGTFSKDVMLDLFVRKLASDEKDRAPLTLNTLIDGKYKMLQKIGSGSYGNVYKAMDVEKDSLRAVKVIKTKHIGTKATKGFIRELRILIHLFTANPENARKYIVQIHRGFTVCSHLFMVYDLLGPSIRDILRNNNEQGFSYLHTREIGFQLVSAINYLHSVGVAHHDIKPDNIAFTRPFFDFDPVSNTKTMLSTELRLIDFGSATFEGRGNTQTFATTRQYRSPELDFRCRWSTASDVWSIGCTLYEVFSGKILFDCDNQAEKFLQMEALFGHIVTKFSIKSKLSCFDGKGRLKFDASTEKYRLSLKNKGSFQELISSLIEKNPGVSQFFDLLSKMLVIDHSLRISTQDILNHLFWEEKISPSDSQF